MKTGAVILCGGKSSRMGTDKAFLFLDNKTFIEHIVAQVDGFDEVFLSVNQPDSRLPSSLLQVMDIFPYCGPMGGLHAALSACSSDALLAISCDLPFYRREVGELLLAQLTPDTDVVVPVSSDGQIHPLCAVYRRDTVSILEQCLRGRDFRLRNALGQMRTVFIDLPNQLLPCLQNINTPQDYFSCCNS